MFCSENHEDQAAQAYPRGARSDLSASVKIKWYKALMKTSFSSNEKKTAPHLRGRNTFDFVLSRELISTAILFFVGIFLGGKEFLFSSMIFILTAIVFDFLFQAMGFVSQPKVDSFLLQQTLLLALLLPLHVAWPVLQLTAFVLVAFYRISGGRSGYFVSPLCMAWIFLWFFEPTPVSSEFALTHLSLFLSAVLFFIWILIRFVRTNQNPQRLFFIFLPAVILNTLHENFNWATACLVSAVASDIIWDIALAPLSPQGRLKYMLICLISYALFLACLPWNEALIFTGLCAGFFAAWIEKLNLKRRQA